MNQLIQSLILDQWILWIMVILITIVIWIIISVLNYIKSKFKKKIPQEIKSSNIHSEVLSQQVPQIPVETYN